MTETDNKDEGEDMKVLIINGSPKKDGNTKTAINEMIAQFDKEGVETEVIELGGQAIRGCEACGSCFKTGKGCVFGDIVNEASAKLEEADGLVVASPVYYASPNGTIVSFLDRLFYSSRFDKTMKVGASVAVARRAGVLTTYDTLNKYFAINNMPIASANYWNNVFGGAPGEAARDEEGMDTMRVLAKNMAFLMKSITLGKEAYGLPEYDPKPFTNFIR